MEDFSGHSMRFLQDLWIHPELSNNPEGLKVNEAPGIWAKLIRTSFTVQFFSPLGISGKGVLLGFLPTVEEFAAAVYTSE